MEKNGAQCKGNMFWSMLDILKVRPGGFLEGLHVGREIREEAGLTQRSVLGHWTDGIVISWDEKDWGLGSCTERGDGEFSLGLWHVWGRRPSVDFEEAVVIVNKGEVNARIMDLRFIEIEMILKTMNPHKVTKSVSPDREERAWRPESEEMPRWSLGRKPRNQPKRVRRSRR